MPCPVWATDQPAERTFCRMDTEHFRSNPQQEIKDGYVDKNGNWSIAPLFTHQQYGQLLIEASFGEPTEGQFFTVDIGNKSQVIHRDGFPFRIERFDTAYIFVNGLLRAEFNGNVYYYDTSGNVAIDQSFQSGTTFHGGLATVTTETGQALIDERGQTVLQIPPGVTIGLPDGKSLLAGAPTPFFDQNEFYGFIDLSGTIIVPPTYDYAAMFYDGMAAVTLNKRQGYVNEHGFEVVPPHYDLVRDFSEGVGAVLRDKVWGYLGTDGKPAIFKRFSFADSFSGGVAAAATDDDLGYIDHSGEWVIPPRFDRAGPFRNGFAIAAIGNRDILIDKTGRDILREDFDFAKEGAKIIPCGMDLYRVGLPHQPGYIADMREKRLSPVQNPKQAANGDPFLLGMFYSDDPRELLADGDAYRAKGDVPSKTVAESFYLSVMYNFYGTPYAKKAEEHLYQMGILP